MTDQIHVTVGPRGADVEGQTHRALQAAVEYVVAMGGGTVEVLPGTYRMGNAVHLRSGVRLIGSGENTVLVKNPSVCTKLTDDTDWYDWHVTVEDPSGFEVGGGLLLRGKDPHGSGMNVTKHTILGIEGNRLRLDSQPRKNMWITHEATASTLFPIVTGNWVKDISIENLSLDGNRGQNDHLDGNYGGCIFLQDCERVHVRGVIARNHNGDGISWQVCHDVTVEECQSLDHHDLGLHPGSGSQRPIIRGNTIRNCRIGLFWCWGVQYGIAEDNAIYGSREYGISIGHRDTDNRLRNNQVYKSGKAGLYFRPEEPPIRCPHRNLVEKNLFEDADIGIDMEGAVEAVVLRENHIVDTKGTMKAGLRIGEHVTDLTLKDNAFQGVQRPVVDLRAGVSG